MWTVCGLLQALFCAPCLDFNGSTEFFLAWSEGEKWRIDGKFVHELLELPPSSFSSSSLEFPLMSPLKSRSAGKKKKRACFSLAFKGEGQRRNVSELSRGVRCLYPPHPAILFEFLWPLF